RFESSPGHQRVKLRDGNAAPDKSRNPAQAGFFVFCSVGRPYAADTRLPASGTSPDPTRTVPFNGTIAPMKKRHATTLGAIYGRPVSGTIRWSDIEALFVALGADVEERSGSRIAIVWQ